MATALDVNESPASPLLRLSPGSLAESVTQRSSSWFFSFCASKSLVDDDDDDDDDDNVDGINRSRPATASSCRASAALFAIQARRPHLLGSVQAPRLRIRAWPKVSVLERARMRTSVNSALVPCSTSQSREFSGARSQ